MDQTPSTNPSQSDVTPSPNSGKRWWQFSLRTLLIFMLVCVFGFAVYGYYLRRERIRNTAVQEVENLGGTLAWNQDDPNFAHIQLYFTSHNLESFKPKELQKLIRALRQLDEISLSDYGKITSLKNLMELKNLVYLRLRSTKVDDHDLLLLTGFPKLRLVDLRKVTALPTTIARLKQLRPELILFLEEVPPKSLATHKVSGKELEILNRQGKQVLKKTFAGDYSVMKSSWQFEPGPLLGIFEWPQTGNVPIDPLQRTHATIHCFDSESGKHYLKSKQQLLELYWPKMIQVGEIFIYTGMDPQSMNTHSNANPMTDPGEVICYFFDPQGNILDEQSEEILDVTFDQQKSYLSTTKRLAKLSPGGTVLWSISQEFTRGHKCELKTLPTNDLISLDFPKPTAEHPPVVYVRCLNAEDGGEQWSDEFPVFYFDADFLGLEYLRLALEFDGQGNVAVLCEANVVSVYKFNSATGELLWKNE